MSIMNNSKTNYTPQNVCRLKYASIKTLRNNPMYLTMLPTTEKRTQTYGSSSPSNPLFLLLIIAKREHCTFRNIL